MSRTAASIVACALGAALLAVSFRAFRRAIACGGEVESRFTRIHGPLAATLLLASAAWAWLWRGGADGGAWAFTITDATIALALAFGLSVLFGRDGRIGTGPVVAFWASAVLAVLVAGGQRVTMIEGQALFLAGLVLVWSGLPRMERRPSTAKPPRFSAAMMHALALATGIAAAHVPGVPAHVGLIALAASILASPALLGAAHGLGASVWFGGVALLIGAGSVPLANTLSIGIPEALAMRAMGSPWWLSHLREAFALNIYTGGSVTILPDAFAMVVLSIVAMFALVSAGDDGRGVRGLTWKAVGITLFGLGVAYAGVRLGVA